MTNVEYRALYARALDPEACPSPDTDLPMVRAAIDPAAGRRDEPERDLAGLVDEACRWAAERRQGFRSVLDSPHRASGLRCVLGNCAPLALSAGAWLQWLSSAGNAESELTLTLLRLYSSDLGVGYPLADRGSAYRAVLRAHRFKDEAPGPRLAASDQVESFSFRLPAVLLTMSRLPDRFRLELVGADLCLRAVGVLPPLAALAPGDLPVPVDAFDLGRARTPDEPVPLDLALAAAQALVDRGDGDRVRHGFRWAAEELALWCDALERETRLATHPDYPVWRLIWNRARQASVYHGQFPLEGRPLAEWFADVDAGPSGFLRALARSTLVRPGEPDRSPLVCGLIGEKGRMFRVFTEQEIALLRDWITHLPQEGSALGAGEDADERHRRLRVAQCSWHRSDTKIDAHPAHASAAGDFGRPTARSAYRALLSRTEPPGLRQFAHRYVRRWLARSRFRMDKAERGLPARWDPDNGLRGWLAAEHDRHGAAWATHDTPLPSREELVESTLQLAPLILIDGGWLQGYTDYRLASSPAGHFLFQTYWDELGNGIWRQNHPKIYRDLLREMGVELPPTDSEEFAAWPGFDDRSFALPVFWLCMAKFPQTFAPEILGLNLAMELSGVGGSYRDAQVALRHHGFSTQFVDLHNTIDNVSTGHSAWAVDAIDTFLAEQPDLAGRRTTDAVWQRIRGGYRSLSPPQGLAAGVYGALTAEIGRR
ncbi:iron-containing redox enzyme family protein [Streptomyces goshikiensis]|uniref:iron-containing redox enzyme family protein n=1 Tax=Streptomyces goshikiensis TaxID=1942 RepID=UPI0022F3ACDF|nr:iron-containing redox enzyme family protein [Streptomyces goshikiensis]WBY23197.1 iron-containing redox enzyme family protein [Streptomyces goshikiensis]